MLTSAPTIEGAFLPYREWAGERTNPLHKASKSYMDQLLAVLGSRKSLPKAVADLRPAQFALRMKALQWLAQEGFDSHKWFKCKEKELKAHEHDAGKGILVMNMLFAIDLCADVMHSLSDRGLELEKMDKSQFKAMDGISFEQFEAVITVGIPHAEAAQMILTWFYSSMDMEAGLLMGEAVVDDSLRISPARVEDLNAFLVPAAQTYGACARIMRLVPVNDAPVAHMVKEPAPKSYIRQQKQLAELGIEDWFKQWA